MKYVDEYRDPELARRISDEIVRLSASQHLKLMEVCGGHTHTIYKHGVEDVLPSNIDLVHGPGCPVCVLPMGRIGDAIAIARMDGVIFTTFGDMMRVPGSKGSLLDAKADGADVRFVYSPLDALMLAREALEIEADVQSDSAPLHSLVAALLDAAGEGVHCLKDPTRGGVATSLNEMAIGSEIWPSQRS
jgi:hydrogenase expression/formation protein HypD